MYPNPNIASSGLSLLKKINFAGILDGTQKTLGVINQAIPVIYQVKPLVNNIGTIFKISNLVNEKSNIKNTTQTNNKNNDVNKPNKSPIFFV